MNFTPLYRYLTLTIFLLLCSFNVHADDKVIHLTARENSLMDKIGEAILQEAYAEIGYKLDVDYLPGTRALRNASRGTSDGVVIRLDKVLSKNPALHKVSTPLWHFNVVTFSTDINNKFESWKSLSGKRLGTYHGYKYIESKLANESLNRSSTFEIGFNMLLRNRTEAIVLGQLDGLSALQKIEQTNVVCHKPIESFPEYHMLHENHVDLIPKIEAVLTKMNDNGRLKSIQDKILLNALGPQIAALCS